VCVRKKSCRETITGGRGERRLDDLSAFAGNARRSVLPAAKTIDYTELAKIKKPPVSRVLKNYCACRYGVAKRQKMLMYCPCTLRFFALLRLVSASLATFFNTLLGGFCSY
jgi:hypothetical protein